MKNRKTKTFVYKGFGFPITLINAPFKKMRAGWVLDVNMQKLETLVLIALIQKPALWTGDEVRFVRKILELTTTDFGALFGVTHVAVLKWENETAKINPSTEVLIRLHMLDYLRVNNDKFRAIYKKLDVSSLAKAKKVDIFPISINADGDNLKIAVGQ